MFNAVLLGMVAFLFWKAGFTDNALFWIAYLAAVFFNTYWWTKIEEKWYEED